MPVASPTAWTRARAIGSVILIAGFIAACSSLLPKGESDTNGLWKSFDEAKEAFDKIEPGRTTVSELKRLGYDPYANNNVAVMNYSEVLSRFAPSAVRDTYLEPGIRECIEAQSRCLAYTLGLQRTHRDRVGNFFLDFINFHRHTDITGWRFDAIVVIVDDRVVHKVWSGQRSIHQVEDTRNPLGPLQDQSTIVLPGKL
jgi:hypothetical protein